MVKENFKENNQETSFPPYHPNYIRKVHKEVVEKNLLKTTSFLEKLFLNEYPEQSYLFDKGKVQESCSVRNVFFTRKLATLLINEEGKIDEERLNQAINLLKQNFYSLGPYNYLDKPRKKHILNVLSLLQKDEKLKKLLLSIGLSSHNRYVENIIKDTLRLKENTVLKDVDAKRATLSAWLCYLRQNVGSCFATAPAIIIHDEYPYQFIKDIKELFLTGVLKRTFGGVEYAVPLSMSWGSGDLKKTIIINKKTKTFLCNSPSLLYAFKKIKICERKNVKEWFKKALESILQEKKTLFFSVTTEWIIKSVLLRELHLSEEDINNVEKESVFIRSVRSDKKKRVEKFFSFFDQVKRLFVSFTDNALLKAWEFTIASFAETKPSVSTWNFYSSLGLKPEEKGGIGERIYFLVNEKLKEFNQKVQDIQYEYEYCFQQLKTIESRLKTASTEQEAKYIRQEYQSKLYEFRSLEEMRNMAHDKARRFSSLFQKLIDLYLDKFSSYFQEVYDPDIQETTPTMFEDSPAGFRLIYKHGRTNPALWTPITNLDEFVDSLSSFFIATETEIIHDPELKGLENEVSRIITDIIGFVKTDTFLESAFYRMAKAHNEPIIKDPLKNLEKVTKKPWAYTSGGTMDDLVSCYFMREEKPTEVSRWVENPMELLVFLADTVKQIPYKETDIFEKNKEKSLLMHSPTHAFLLKPGLDPFLNCWKTKKFTYTWIRDRFFIPQNAFVETLYLDKEMMLFFIKRFSEKLPEEVKDAFINSFSYIPHRLKISDFRDIVVEGIKKNKVLSKGGFSFVDEADVDSRIYQWFPLTYKEQITEKVNEILKGISFLSKKDIEKIEENINGFTEKLNYKQLITVKELKNMIKAAAMLAMKKSLYPFDFSLSLVKAMRKCGYHMPEPIYFADSNWVKDYFAFIVNPGTGDFELWRVDNEGNQGSPMKQWEKYLNGSVKDPKWGVYYKKREYTF